MFKAVYDREEEKGAKRDVLQQTLVHLLKEREKIRALMKEAEKQEKELTDKLHEVKPLSPAILALMQQMQSSSGMGKWQAHLLLESDSKKETVVFPPEVAEEMNKQGVKLVKYKAGPWEYEAWHEGKCEDCRSECREVTSVCYEGKNPAVLKFQDKDGAIHRVEVDAYTFSDPDPDDADWECIDCDQSVGTAYSYLTFAIYRA